MRTFALELSDATQFERIEPVASFIGEDASGSFGILAGRERLVTVLGWGLCRYAAPDRVWRYVALPGGTLSFADGVLSIATRHYVRGDDPGELQRRLEAEIAAEEASRRGMVELIRTVDRELLRGMLRLD